jgi:TonB family protein
MTTLIVRIVMIALSLSSSATIVAQRNPRKIKDAKPVYPPESLRVGDEGMIILELDVNASGIVHDARILLSHCQRLEKAALTAVHQWRYEEVRVNGKPTPFKVTATVPFRLPPQFKSRAARPGACKWTDPPKRITSRRTDVITTSASRRPK